MEKENYVELYTPKAFTGLMIRRLQNDQIFGIYAYDTDPNSFKWLDQYSQYYLVRVISQKNEPKIFEFIKTLIDYHTEHMSFRPYDKEKDDDGYKIKYSTHLLKYYAIASFFKFCNIKTESGEVLDKRIYLDSNLYFHILKDNTEPPIFTNTTLVKPIKNKVILSGLVALIKIVDRFANEVMVESSLMLDNYKTRDSDLIFNRISFANYIEDDILLKSLKEDFGGVFVKVAEKCDDCDEPISTRHLLYFVKYDIIGYHHMYDDKNDIINIILDIDDIAHSTYCRGHAYINDLNYNMNIIPREEMIRKYNKEKEECGDVTNEIMLVIGKLPSIDTVFTNIEFVRTVCSECGEEINAEIE